jgi:hypothetical protein
MFSHLLKILWREHLGYGKSNNKFFIYDSTYSKHVFTHKKHLFLELIPILLLNPSKTLKWSYLLELALLGKLLQRGSKNSVSKVSTRDGNSSVESNLSRALYGGIYRCLSAHRLGLRTHVPSGALVIPGIFP